MESSLKAPTRPGGSETSETSDFRAALSEGEATVGSGLPLDDDLEQMARNLSQGGISDILSSWPEERSERILALFETMTNAVAQLSDELCKEDHGRFMKLAALIEAVAGKIDAQLIALKRDVEGQAIVAPGLFMRFVAVFSPRIRRLVSQMESQKAKRTLTLQTVREYRELADRLRKKPKEIHEAAVQHVKRLLLQEDENYRLLNHLVAVVGEKITDANSKGWWEKVREYTDQLKALKEERPRLEQEAYDRALQKVQESDNGPTK